MTELSLEFIQTLLKEDYQDVTITEFEGAPGSKRGDNYTSMLYRISLKGIRHLPNTEAPWEGSIIYKCLPKSIVRREAFKSDELFRNEVAFYTKIWPCFLNFQNKWAIAEPFNAIPKCYLARNDCVILKDLKQYGFVMPDRRQGLTIAECYTVLKQLSQFHAISLAMKCHQPDEFYELLNEKDGITEVFFVEDKIDYFRKYYDAAINNAISMVEDQLQDSPDKDFYLEKFRKFCSEDTFFLTMINLVKPREPLAVICHGDCWTNNFLFRYAEEEIAEMCMVDFQLVRYGSPALDLAYIMFLCLSRDQRRQHQTNLLDFYVDNLHARLLEMSDEEPIFLGHLSREKLREAIHDEFKLSAQFGLGIALDMYPIMNCDSNEAPNLYQAEDNSDTASVQPVNTTNSACKKKMTDLLQELVDDGLL